MALAIVAVYGVDRKLIRLLKDVSEDVQVAVRLYGETGEWFTTNRGIDVTYGLSSFPT